VNHPLPFFVAPDFLRKRLSFLAEIMMILKISLNPQVFHQFQLQSPVFHSFPSVHHLPTPFFSVAFAGRPHWPSAQRFAMASAMGVAAIRGDLKLAHWYNYESFMVF